MNNIQKVWKTPSLFLLSLFISIFAIAQEGGTDINVDINKGGGAA